MIINAKKAISGGSKILTYFFTRNVPFDRYKELLRLLSERAEGKEYLGNSVAAGKRVRTLKPHQMTHFVVVMVNEVL